MTRDGQDCTGGTDTERGADEIGWERGEGGDEDNFLLAACCLLGTVISTIRQAEPERLKKEK
ncbi:predicted protein [Plenodomus lingam JN3]|uniref:Predicted protein n=1 Tax=Leptosphaeria maculans (strain JN3 / isolate v23.1.3 / race Av1-4-5-6-7-8) TaxID=985895 RepID=E5A462_LEPMJ|nr:predicted protein [Plenodomus lingam JN3]CBX98407.1 predicted protein [Plenodomus lingam JN3]